MTDSFSSLFIQPISAPKLFQDSRLSVFASEFRTDRYSAQLHEELRIPLPPTLENASSLRKSEYLAGRLSARWAFSPWGISDDFVLASLPNRAPLWPEGLTGSITHSRGKCFVVTAKSEHVRAVGIDAENVIARKAELAKVETAILQQSESLALDRLITPLDRTFVVGIYFVLKESIYKAIQPITGERFNFTDIVISRLDLNEGKADWKMRGQTGQANFNFDGEWVHAMTLVHLHLEDT